MACELITPPTGGAPLGTGDYDAQNQVNFAPLVALMQNTKHLTEWNTLNAPEVEQYSYIQQGGALFQVKTSDSAIAGAPANGRVYVKATRAGDVLTFAFIINPAGYLWNTVYNGFYHADGTQLLPYVLYKDGTDYYKFTLDHSEDKFNITANLNEERTIDVGVWDMDADPTKTLFGAITYSNDIVVNIDHITIRKDNNVEKLPLDVHPDPGFTEAQGTWIISYPNINLYRLTGGSFDNANFDDGNNRGWISLKLKI